ncbi:NAD-dependent epimerase/dehydratase family protein [Acidimicrobiia bacterium]|nr:NAD-dependent epimerase/dehydratase family protein [Acidimicrobiia bacterium]
MSKKVLIFGATGWLGKITLDYLNRYYPKYEIILVSSSSGNFNMGTRNYTTISSQEALELKSQNIDFFLNYAFLTQDKIKKLGNSLYLKQTNKIIDFYKEFVSNNTVKKSLLISSGAVYWKNTNKENLYSLQKINQENDFLDSSKAKKIDYIIARVFAIIGNYYDPNKKYAFVDFVESAKLKKTINISSKNKVERSYLYFESFLDYYFKTQDFNKTIDAWNENLDIVDLANIIADSFGVKVNVIDEYYKQNEVDRYISKDDYFKNIAKAKIDDNLIRAIFFNP